MKSEKKENRTVHITKEFVLLLVVSVLIGFLMGISSKMADKAGGMENVVSSLKLVSTKMIPFVLIITSVLGMLVPVWSFMKCRRMYQKLQSDWDNENLLDTLEEKINAPLIESNIFLILNIFLFFCGVHLIMNSDYLAENKVHLVLAIISAILAIASFVTETLVQSAAVTMEKKLNPEKKGNVFDSNFQREWLESCDEAQKLMVYKAAYKAFSVTNIACTVLFVVAFAIIEFLKLDIFSLLLVALIWGINVTTYSVTCAKLEKRK